MPTILVIGTLDTKGAEIGFLAELIEAQRCRAVLVDASTRTGGASTEALAARFTVVSRAEVALAGGTTIELLAAMERGEAVAAMRGGVAAVAVAMATQGEIDGAICIGGAGAHLAGPAFQQLELGFPKLIVSPLASGGRTFEPYVGLRDVAVLHSVADIAGLNVVTTRVFREAAGYIVGAARSFAGQGEADERRPTIAMSMNGNTTPALTRAIAQLEETGFSCVAFHANGVGGRALEDFVASGRAAGVLDFTTTELSAHVVGGLMDSGPTRMEAAGRRGVPQVLVPGCVDFITAGRWEAAEREFPGRRMYNHNPELTLVRLNVDEMRVLGQIFAAKANRATGPTVVCVPTGGFSVPDAPGGPFWDVEADTAFGTALRQGLQDRVRLEFIEAHVNDDSFVDAVVSELRALLEPVHATDVGAGTAG